MENFKGNLLKLLHKFYRFDEFINCFIEKIETLVNDLNNAILFLETLLHFNKIKDDGCEWWAKLLDIKLSQDLSLSEKQALIRAKWRATGHNSLKLIKDICESWEDGKTKASFPDGKIRLEFGDELNDDYQIPFNLETLLNLIEEVKPAHLPIGLKFILSHKQGIYMATGLTESVTSEYYCINEFDK